MLDMTHWQNGAFNLGQAWSASGIDGLPLKKENLIFQQLRLPGGVFQEWQFSAGGSLKKFQQFGVSTEGGIAAGKDLVRAVEVQGGRFIETTFKDGVASGARVLDAAVMLFPGLQTF